MSERLKIGISACFFHADPARPIFTGKTLQYIEQSVAHWVGSQGALPVMIPSPAGETSRGAVALADYAGWLDGLVLMGGSDVWPGSYGEEPMNPKWSGDRVRDEYETALTKAFVAAGKPVFGVCRGLQLLNVAFGGTLLQDIGTQQPAVADAPRRRALRPQFPCGGVRAGHAAGAALRRQRSRHGQQRAPPGHQGSGRRTSLSKHVAPMTR